MRRRPIVTLDGDFEQLKEPLNLGPPGPVTLSFGTITINRTIHYINNVIGSNNVFTILGGEPGDLLILGKTVSQQITLKDSPFGNLFITEDHKLQIVKHNITLVYTGLGWLETSVTK